MVKARQRSRRKDPEQEAIVQQKDEINDRMSKLIELLKEVKRGMNGGPAPEVGVPEKVNLTQPMPDSVPSAGQGALQELSALVQGIRQVDQMQDAYSTSREQRLQDRMKEMQELQQQAAVEEELLKLASNRLTRTWAHIVAPFRSEEGKWDRLSLLRALARMDHNLRDVENKVLSGDPSILDALHIATQLYGDARATFFDEFRKQLHSMLESTKGEFARVKEDLKEEKRKVDEFEPTEPLVDSPTMPDGKDPFADFVEPEDAPKKDDPKPKSKIDNLIEQADQAEASVQQAVEDNSERIEQTQESNRVVEEQSNLQPSVVMPNIPDSEEGKSTVEKDPFEDFVQPEPDVKPEYEKDPFEGFVEKPKSSDVPESGERESRKSKSINVPTELPPPPEESELSSEQLKSSPSSPGDIPDAPESEPSVDVDQMRRAMRLFIWNKAHDLYSEIGSGLAAYAEAPDPWYDRLKDLWGKIQRIISVIRQKPDWDDEWVKAFLMFTRAVGEMNANAYVMQAELEASKTNPDIVYGSTINDEQIASQAKQYVQTQWEELQPLIPPDDGLVSEGSNRITRWLKRMTTHLSWGRDKHLRLIVDKQIRRAREGLQAMMDTLEQKDINFRRLIAQSDAFYDSFIEVYDKLYDLAKAYNSRMMMEKSKRKNRNSRMPYDTIREGDITAMRHIRNALVNDRKAIQELDQFESKYTEIQRELERMRVERGAE